MAPGSLSLVLMLALLGSAAAQSSTGKLPLPAGHWASAWNDSIHVPRCRLAQHLALVENQDLA